MVNEEWILVRSKDGKRQIYYDKFNIWQQGFWADPLEKSGGIRLPLRYENRGEAELILGRWQRLEPEWNYMIDEWLR